MTDAQSPSPDEGSSGQSDVGSADGSSVKDPSVKDPSVKDPSVKDPSGEATSAEFSAAAMTANDWVGKVFGKYSITGLLGRGGMGMVFRAHDETLSRNVAIKVLPHSLSDNEVARNRFLAEAKSAAQISHPNVVSIFEVGRQGQEYFIVMELIPGGNIDEILSASGAPSVPEATRIVTEACRGLVAAHETGLVHRDIKPANLLRMPDGTVKLADFGLAKGGIDREKALTRDGQLLGTPYFMSPEQCQAKPVDHRSDIYSLGATYYNLLTGKPPYSDASSEVEVMFAHCQGSDLDPRNLSPAVPEACAQVVLRATAKDPGKRFQSAADMLAALTSIQQRQYQLDCATDTLDGTTLPPSTEPKRRSFVLPALILLALVLLAGGAAAWMLANRGNSATADGSGMLFRGVTADTITFGTTTAYSGANRDLGRNVVFGIRACFEAVNAAGGVNGRQLKLVVLDDGYEPERALANMDVLFDEKEAFGVIGNVGTPTAKVTAPYAVEHGYLFFAPFTGASFLRQDPPERYVFNYRAGYVDETAAIIRYFVEILEIPPTGIAVFAQSDSFGDDGFRGVSDALRGHGIRTDDILRVGYDRNTIQVGEAVEAVVAKKEQIRAVVMISSYKATARFVAQVKEQTDQMRFAAVSFVGSEALAQEFREIGPEYGEGVIVTQVVPFYMSNATGVRRYRAALEQYFPEASPGFVSLEGFIAAECLVEGLRRVEGELTTESLVDALDSVRDVDLGVGPLISFSPSRHQASSRVWGTALDKSATFRTLDLERP